jgi:seryl-tRNA synthetase
MLDIKFIRENLEIVKKAAVDKNRPVDWDKLLTLDQKRRDIIAKIDLFRAQRNKLAALRDESVRDRAKAVKDELKTYEEALRETEAEFENFMLTVPNVPHQSVPVGKDESGNVELKKEGKIPEFDFQPRDHIELMKKLGLVDLERGTNVAGFRGYFLTGKGALLEIAVLAYAFKKLAEKGYVPLIAPSLVKEFTFFGNGQFPWGREEVYHLEKDDLYLAGTAEVPVTAYHAGEIIDFKSLPKKYVAWSPCFRREAGSYGKDTKGLYRVHQFTKVEQVVIAPHDEGKSLVLHDELLENAEELLHDFGLPYRVLLMCTGDMGEPQVKKYDLETWMPGRGGYGETMSNSYMGDFQARRLKIRYRGDDGQVRFCDTLNNTAIASPRILIAIVENYQQKDGSVIVPEVLRPYVGSDVIKG